MDITVNSQSVFKIDYPNVNTGSLTLGHPNHNSGSVSVSSASVNVAISYDNKGNPGAKAYLDYIEIQGKKQLIANGNQFSFRSFEAVKSTGIIQYEIQNSNNVSQLWDVTDYTNPSSIENFSSGNSFTFKANAGSLKEYIVLNDANYLIPVVEDGALIANQNLHAIRDVNYILITNQELASQAQRIADYHKNNTGLTTQVVELSKIYNEFGSGSPDVTAIRNFIKHENKLNFHQK